MNRSMIALVAVLFLNACGATGISTGGGYGLGGHVTNGTITVTIGKCLVAAIPETNLEFLEAGDSFVRASWSNGERIAVWQAEAVERVFQRHGGTIGYSSLYEELLGEWIDEATGLLEQSWRFTSNLSSGPVAWEANVARLPDADGAVSAFLNSLQLNSACVGGLSEVE